MNQTNDTDRFDIYVSVFIRYDRHYIHYNCTKKFLTIQILRQCIQYTRLNPAMNKRDIINAIASMA